MTRTRKKNRERKREVEQIRKKFNSEGQRSGERKQVNSENSDDGRQNMLLIKYSSEN